MSTICPKDYKTCIDDVCRGSGICALTGGDMLDRCTSCGGIYSHDFAIACACEDEGENWDDDDDDWECFEDTCVCSDGMCGDSEAED